jgi:NADP-dependent 3-hydroxy acid dehydrogenase YdfG
VRPGQEVGLTPQALLERLKIDEWNRAIDVNIKGVLRSIAAALPYMKQLKAGHFIAGRRVGPGFAVYAATKYAVRALSEGVCPRGEAYSIRTTMMPPGAVTTELPNTVTRSAGLRENPELLCGGSCRVVRASGRLRHEPAGGG